MRSIPPKKRLTGLMGANFRIKRATLGIRTGSRSNHLLHASPSVQWTGAIG
jgi:hypothetical protein